MFNRETIDAVTRAARDCGLEPSVLLAVCEVESGGRVFARVDGRDEPLIRFEGHYFYRLLPVARRNLAVTRGLAHRQAGKVPNPWRQAARWRLLEKACDIDRDAALQSASWGIGQVMGIHWKWLGYASADDLAGSARSGVAGQLELMMRYISKAGLMPALRERDWAGFARAYNGPEYAKYGYHLKLARAHSAYQEPSRQTSPVRNRANHIRLGSRGALTRELQELLVSAGYPLAADGDFGPATLKALQSFQLASGLVADGIAGPQTLEALMRHAPQPGNLLA